MKLSKYICCPECKSDLLLKGKELQCNNCNQTYLINNGIINMMCGKNEHSISISKWDIYYQDLLKGNKFSKFIELYDEHFILIHKQLNAVKKIKNIAYLEIGCGPFLMGAKIADKCDIVIGIDFCPTALKIAQKYFKKKGIKNYILIQGDILKIPIKNNVCDLIYGGGVIEHFKETETCLTELYRITKKNGVVFNSVPYLNIGALTYRQIWGNIPNFPIIREIAETLHIRLLKGKHMVFGYEYSFTRSSLIKMHRKAGFKEIIINKFVIPLELKFVPIFFLKPVKWLAKNSYLFCPMIKVIGYKK